MHVPDLLTDSAAYIYPDAHLLKTPYKRPGGGRILPAFSPTKYRYSKIMHVPDLQTDSAACI